VEWSYDRETMGELTIEDLNRGNRAAFIEALGDVYEHSPWVAEWSWSERPFSSVEDLHGSMASTVRNASREEKLKLLRAHPDLGERTEMTDASEGEQAAAGLDELGPEQHETFERLNGTYRERFGFPFIMAVSGERPDAIQGAMETRIEHSKAEELRTVLEEVDTIAGLRLEGILASEGSEP
jgi:2-oxo-4-hydroxy-4-carboxy-5-ureidoimidazoline decarboxylase